MINKYIHEILQNRRRYREMKITEDSHCKFCGAEESNIHMVYFCKKIANILVWLKEVLKLFCNFMKCNFIRVMYFDFPEASKKQRNTATLILSSYIVNIWLFKDKNVNERLIINRIKASITRCQREIKTSLKDKMFKLFTRNFCNIESNAF